MNCITFIDSMDWKSLLRKKWLWFLIIAVILQIITIVLVFDFMKDNEDNDINDFLTKTSEIILKDFENVYEMVNHIIQRNCKIFEINGKYIPPDVFSNYVTADTLPDIVSVRFQRWYPKITQAERATYEAYGEQYINTNFTILDVVQIFPSLIFKSADVRDFYLPFTLSVDTFFGSLGGDLYNSSQSNKDDIDTTLSNQKLTINRRVRLFELDSSINYGIRMTSPVYETNSNMTFDDLIGITSIIFIPDNILTKIIKAENINRDVIDIFIYDLSDTIPDDISLIFHENKPEYEKFRDRTSIPQIKSIKNSYNNVINVLGRSYYFQFVYSNEFLDDERTFFPEGIIITLCVLFVSLDVISIIVFFSYKKNLELIENKTNYNILRNVNHHMRNPINGIKGNIELIIFEMSKWLTKKEIFDINSDIIDTVPSTEITASSKSIRDEYLKPLFDTYYLILSLSNTVFSADYITNRNINASDSVNVKYSLGHIAKHITAVAGVDIDEHNNIKYTTNVSDPEHEIYTDLDKLTQIIIIYLKNAFNHTPNGSVRLDIVKQMNDVYFKIIDTGTGVIESSLIFKQYNLHKSNGLTTYHAKLIADSMNAEVGYKELDLGTMFYVKLANPIILDTDLDEVVTEKQ